MRTPDHAIPLAFTGEQSSLIIAVLAQRPFRLVFELIGQLHAGAQAGAGARVAVTPQQLRPLLQTLRGMPGEQAAALLNSLHQQLRAHVDGLGDE